MTDEDYLEAQRKAIAESVDFFRSEKKSERERWVVNEFLMNLGFCFTEREVRSVRQDPPDVQFRDAAFEIKEILTEGRRRHQEYKENLDKAVRATKPSDLLEDFTPRDTTISDVYVRILKEATTLANEKYPLTVRKELDLLFYVNLNDVFGLIETPFPDTASLTSLNWRSVSFLMGYRSCTLVAEEHAPNFIKDARGFIIHRGQGKSAKIDIWKILILFLVGGGILGIFYWLIAT
ncbi:MAG: hypothetical protein EPN55_07940 [Gammaproteobacteria bacterium]|nr:MAG: hypothetical protein EPN55_07940 [Gammaproteobacteria bacterium]